MYLLLISPTSNKDIHDLIHVKQTYQTPSPSGFTLYFCKIKKKHTTCEIWTFTYHDLLVLTTTALTVSVYKNVILIYKKLQ